MVCLNATCEALGQVRRFPATSDLGAVFLDGDPDTTCGACSWDLVGDEDWGGGLALITPPHLTAFHDEDGNVLAVLDRYPAALVWADGVLEMVGTVKQLRVEQTRRAMAAVGGKQIRRCSACSGRGVWDRRNPDDAHLERTRFVDGELAPVPACRWCDGSGLLTTTGGHEHE